MPTVDLVSPGGAFSPGAVGDGVTDDAPAVRAFNTWAQAQVSPITLTCGTGSKTFLISGADSSGLRANSLAYNVSQPLTVMGNGRTATIFKTPDSINLGSLHSLKSGDSSFGSIKNWTARLFSIGAGNTVLRCKSAGDTAQFSTNTWAILAGCDLQAAGDPPNSFYFEFVFITAINAGAGTVTVLDPIANTYLETWPNYLGNATPGSILDRGGPATLYALDPAWNIEPTFQSLQFNQGAGQSYAKGRKITFNDVLWTGSNIIAPTLNQSFSFVNCDLSNIFIEVDKLISELIFDSTINVSTHFQNSIDRLTIKNNSNVKLNGTPRRVVIDNSTIPTFNIGSISFGRTESIRATNTAFTSWQYTPLEDKGDITNTTITADYSMSGGIIKVLKASLPAYGIRWGIPGTWCYWELSLTNYGPTFQVLEVWDDASYVYVRTNQTGGFPAGAFGIRVHPCLDAIFQGCTGVSQAVNLTNALTAGFGGKPMQRYASTTFNGNNMGGNGTGQTVGLPDFVVGKIVSYTINVTTPYTGSGQPTLTWNAAQQFANNNVVKPDFSLAVWAPVINLKVAGSRVIAPTGVTFNGSPGSGSGDSGLALPDPNAWVGNLGQTGLGASANVSAEYTGNPLLGPVFTVTAITDPGIIWQFAPRRLGLHA